MNKKVKSVINVILEMFKSGDVPEAIAKASFPTPDLPSSKWSFLNRTLMVLSGTCDARGIRQWNSVKRKVKKGAKAFYILVPCFKKTTGEKTDEEKEVPAFFKTTPVFRVEDTDGEKLDYQNIELPELPLIEKANEWGISVKAVPGNYRYYGYYSSNKSEIALATPEESVFFHELSHAAHEKVVGKLKSVQNPLQEIVAQLSAEVLCRVIGKTGKDTVGDSYQYIEKYSRKLKLSPYAACLKVLGDVEKVLGLILDS